MEKWHNAKTRKAKKVEFSSYAISVISLVLDIEVIKLEYVLWIDLKMRSFTGTFNNFNGFG